MLGSQVRELFDACQKIASSTYCDGLYLNANTPVRTCMERHGYRFTGYDYDHGYGGTCTFGHWRQGHSVLRFIAVTGTYMRRSAVPPYPSGLMVTHETDCPLPRSKAVAQRRCLRDSGTSTKVRPDPHTYSRMRSRNSWVSGRSGGFAWVASLAENNVSSDAGLGQGLVMLRVGPRR